jgi:hypothetical protein
LHTFYLLTFLYHDAPSDNNGLERVIRLAKIHKKISNGKLDPNKSFLENLWDSILP